MLSRQLERQIPLFVALGVALGQLSVIAFGIWRSIPNISSVTRMFTLGVMGSLATLIFIYIPEIGIGLYLFNGIFKTANIFGDPNSIVPTLVILGFTIGVLVFRMPGAGKIPIRVDSVFILLVAFNLLLYVSAVAVGNSPEKPLRLIFFTAMSMLLAYLVTLNPVKLLHAFRYTVLLGLITATLSIVTFLGTSSTGIRSVTLFASNDVIFGRTLAIGILMSIGLFLFDESLPSRWRLIVLISLPVMLISLVLSTSRGATVGLIATIPFALLIHRKSPPLWIFGVGGVAAVAYLYVTATWSGQVQDLTNFSIFRPDGQLDLSSQLRLLSYEKALNTYLANPILGIGTKPNWTYPHNIFLEVASEIGTVGLGIFLALGWLLFRKVRHLLAHPANQVSLIVTQLTAIGAVYSLVIAQFSGNLQHQRPLWLFIAFIWALPLQGNDQSANIKPAPHISISSQ